MRKRPDDGPLNTPLNRMGPKASPNQFMQKPQIGLTLSPMGPRISCVKNKVADTLSSPTADNKGSGVYSSNSGGYESATGKPNKITKTLMTPRAFSALSSEPNRYNRDL